jgi:hypothetical protein
LPEIPEVAGPRPGRPYPSDLTDEEWALLAPLLEYCEKEGIGYTVGLISTLRHRELAEPLIERAKERHEAKGHKARPLDGDFYQAGSWDRQQRVVYKAEVMEEGTNTRFPVTTTGADEPEELYDRYVGRGESENRTKLQTCPQGRSAQLLSSLATSFDSCCTRRPSG